MGAALVTPNCAPELTFPMVSLPLQASRASLGSSSCDSQLRSWVGFSIGFTAIVSVSSCSREQLLCIPTALLSSLFRWFHCNCDLLGLVSKAHLVTANCDPELLFPRFHCHCKCLELLSGAALVTPNSAPEHIFTMVSLPM